MRPRSTFMKRQKELARQQKQREKAARRQQRKSQRPFPAGDEAQDAAADTFAAEQIADGSEEATTEAQPGERTLGGAAAAAIVEHAAIPERKETP